jgi:hypothetical protein
LNFWVLKIVLNRITGFWDGQDFCYNNAVPSIIFFEIVYLSDSPNHPISNPHVVKRRETSPYSNYQQQFESRVRRKGQKEFVWIKFTAWISGKNWRGERTHLQNLPAENNQSKPGSTPAPPSCSAFSNTEVGLLLAPLALALLVAPPRLELEFKV